MALIDKEVLDDSMKRAVKKKQQAFPPNSYAANATQITYTQSK